MLPVYQDLAIFRLSDIVGYINSRHDLFGVSYRDILEKDTYLNFDKETLNYLNKNVKYDKHGAYFIEVKGYDVRVYTSERIHLTDTDPKRRKDFFLSERMEEMEKLSSADLRPKSINPPWLFNYHEA
ncbi:hypothetical protein C6W91_16875 [Phaeobacter sp. SYSU ZJ3003]